MATRGQELIYSNSRLDRFLGKIVTAFTPEGDLTKSLFASQKVMEGFKASDLNRATELIKQLDRGISRAFPQMQEVLDRSLTTKEKDKFYKELNELLFDGDLTKLSDPKKTDTFIKDLAKKGVDEKTVKNIIDTIDESRLKIGGLIEATGNLNSKEFLVCFVNISRLMNL